MTVLVPPLWTALDQKRCVGIDALRLENDAALFRIETRKQRHAERKHTVDFICPARRHASAWLIYSLGHLQIPGATFDALYTTTDCRLPGLRRPRV